MSGHAALLDDVAALASQAAAAVLQHYEAGESLGLRYKDDQSPVTQADRDAHEIIMTGLGSLCPGTPLLSEEGESLNADPDSFWLIDPLDGTREYLARNGQFTINIALVEAGHPVLGLIHVPCQGVTYGGGLTIAAWCAAQGRRRLLKRSAAGRIIPPLRVTVSRSQGEASLAPCRQLLDSRFPAYEVLEVGSALKFCMLAEGSAELYPRFTPTCAWDTAAGQALLEAAGGAVLGADGRALVYKSASRWRNGAFLAFADREQDWEFLLAAIPRSDDR